MNYIAIKDLKRTKMIQEELVREKELILTRNGKPCALMIGLDGSSCENTLKTVRRALFASAVSSGRLKAMETPLEEKDIQAEIKMVRKART